MKKIIAVLLVIILSTLTFCGCEPPTEIDREKYEIKYKITYDDESVKYEWKTVDKETYEKARDKLP